MAKPSRREAHSTAIQTQMTTGQINKLKLVADDYINHKAILGQDFVLRHHPKG